MQEELSTLNDNNLALQENVTNFLSESKILKSEINDLATDNATLQQQFENLNLMVLNLQAVEEELKETIATLSEQVSSNSDEALKSTIEKIENLRSDTRNELDNIIEKMNSLETNLKQSPKFGIFSYIAEDDQPTFIRTVDDAVAQESTFTKINEYLSENLSPELDKTIKDHPSLTKTYIKNFK